MKTKGQKIEQNLFPFNTPKNGKENYFLLLLNFGFNTESKPKNTIAPKAIGRNASVATIDMPADPPRSITNSITTNIFSP